MACEHDGSSTELARRARLILAIWRGGEGTVGPAANGVGPGSARAGAALALSRAGAGRGHEVDVSSAQRGQGRVSSAPALKTGAKRPYFWAVARPCVSGGSTPPHGLGLRGYHEGPVAKKETRKDP